MDEIKMDPVTALRNLGAAAASVSAPRKQHAILVASEQVLGAFIQEHSDCGSENGQGDVPETSSELRSSVGKREE